MLFDRDAGLVSRTGDVARGSLFVGDQLDVACLVEFSNSIGEREDRDGFGVGVAVESGDAHAVEAGVVDVAGSGSPNAGKGTDDTVGPARAGEHEVDGPAFGNRLVRGVEVDDSRVRWHPCCPHWGEQQEPQRRKGEDSQCR